MSLRARKPAVIVIREVTVTNELGLHARPAAQFVRTVGAFHSDVWLIRYGERFSGASLIEIMRANVDSGARVTLEAHGSDAVEAIAALEKLLSEWRDRD